MGAVFPCRSVVAIIAAAVALQGCGAGSMGRAVTTAGEGFDRGACLSEQFRTGKPCDQDEFSPAARGA